MCRVFQLEAHFRAVVHEKAAPQQHTPELQQHRSMVAAAAHGAHKWTTAATSGTIGLIDVAIYDQMLAALKDCTENLSDRAQRALQLRYRDQATREQIATDLDLSPHGAKNLLQRAKQRLRDCLKRKLND